MICKFLSVLTQWSKRKLNESHFKHLCSYSKDDDLRIS